MTAEIRQLTSGDLPLFFSWLHMFGEAFGEPERYTGNLPSQAYAEQLLARDSFIAIAALKQDQVVGGIAAYELHKFEQPRSEIYIYDLAVDLGHRRQGIATALIGKLQEIAQERGACGIYVQADTSEEDEAAIALYSKLGTRREVLHFDIPVPPAPNPA